MIFRRRERLDPFEVAVYSRREVFVRVSDAESLSITARSQGLSIVRWCDGQADVEHIQYLDEVPGLHDGQAWDIPALASWLKSHCAVCWQPLGGKQQYYCSAKCRQKAYRERQS